MTLFRRGTSSAAAGRREPSAPLPAPETQGSTDPPPPAPPLGWYPDPDNRSALRFWNGDAWDAADGAALTIGPGERCLPEQLCSPSEAGRLRASGFEKRRPWARSPRILLAAVLAAPGIVAAALALQTESPACSTETEALGFATTSQEGRLTDCVVPEVQSPRRIVDPEGPHGPHPPAVVARCYFLDPGV